MNISEGGESRNLEAAFVYLELGWSIIPVHGIVDGACTCGKPDCDRAGKHPRIYWDEFKERRATEHEIRSWFTKWPESNVGIVTGSISGICVLDVDGEEGMTNLINADLEPPETLTSRTGGGGWHFIYRLPEGGIRNSAGKIAEKVDIRGEGGYIVVPPSNHISGGIYEWELDTNAKLEHLDEYLSVIIELPHTEHDAYLRPLAKSTGITIKNLRAQVQAHADTSVEDEPVDQKIIEAGRQFAEQLGDRVMEELDKSTQAAGVVGESANTKILYLVVTSRLLSNPASAVVKGVSSGGKSFTVKKVIDHFPPRTLIIRTGMSPKALAYTDESLKHRTIVLYEVEGIPEDGEYLIRSLLSEGRVAYETVESTPLGLKPRVIVKEGPTNLIATTTRSRIHPENEL